jgi:hypothetical protein
MSYIRKFKIFFYKVCYHKTDSVHHMGQHKTGILMGWDTVVKQVQNIDIFYTKMNKYENSYMWFVNKLWYKCGKMHTEEIFITDSMHMIINRSLKMIAIFLTKFYMYQFRITLRHNFDIPAITNQPHGSRFSFET